LDFSAGQCGKTPNAQLAGFSAALWFNFALPLTLQGVINTLAKVNQHDQTMLATKAGRAPEV
jgi:hypothetical protein